MKSPVIAIVGPTAVGKSRLATTLAERTGGAILSADSRQVYRYMDIGTAKPSTRDRAIVPHYMLDLVAPDERFSAQRYRQEGLRALQRLACEERVAFVTGGTGFYIRALLDGKPAPQVAPDEQLRRRLRAEMELHGGETLHQRLRQLDPRSAERIHPNNVPRLIRALEIVEHLQGPVPEAPREDTIPALFVGLSMDRSELHEVADRRVMAQVDQGLVQEARLLLEMGFSPELPALDGFGYRQMIAHIQGTMSLEQAVHEYQSATRAYIRRQMTWFRADSRITWFDARDDTASKVESLIRARFTSISW